jgi:hypothetical protein
MPLAITEEEVRVRRRYPNYFLRGSAIASPLAIPEEGVLRRVLGFTRRGNKWASPRGNTREGVQWAVLAAIHEGK